MSPATASTRRLARSQIVECKMSLKKNAVVAVAAISIMAGCSTEQSPSSFPTESLPRQVSSPSDAELRREAELRAKREAEEAAKREAEKRAAAARKRKAARLATATEDKMAEALLLNREREAKLAKARKRELERQEQHRQSVAKTKERAQSMSIVTYAFDHAVETGTILEEVSRIRRESASHQGVMIGGFRLGMDIQDAYLLAKAIFKNVPLVPDSNRGQLRIRIGAAESIDMSDSLEGAFVAGMFGNDASFEFATADTVERKVNSFRFTAEMAKNLLGLDGPVSNDELARNVFRRLGLDWDYDVEYDAYIFRSSTEVLIGYTKATKLANSLTVVNPGDFTLRQ